MKTVLIPLIVTMAVGCATHAQQPAAKPITPPQPIEEDVYIVAQAPPGGLPAPVLVPPKAPRVHLEPMDMPFKFGFSSSGTSRRTLVIPKGEPNPDLLANAEEDLNVMSLILDKAADARGEDEGKKALGIDIFSSSSGIRNLFIEGHGVIFTLKTKTTLVPPPAPKKEEVKEKENTSSEWDEARRQLYGPSEIEKEIHRAWGKVQTSFSSSEEYDAKKVERLKNSLIEALKSASNIRGLSGDQHVTVVVLSSSPVGEVRKIIAEAGRGGGGGGGGGTSSDRRRMELYAKSDRERDRSESRSGARLMLQAKKSDIDAYAKGKLNTDSFHEKVKVQIY